MVLNTNSGLFGDRSPLYDDDEDLNKNLLKERWQQNNGALKVWYYSGNLVTSTRYTVPAGKVVYVTQFTNTCGSGSSAIATLFNGGTALTVIKILSYSCQSITFSTPLGFTAGQTIKLTQDPDSSTTISGWEEDAA